MPCSAQSISLFVENHVPRLSYTIRPFQQYCPKKKGPYRVFSRYLLVILGKTTKNPVNRITRKFSRAVAWQWTLWWKGYLRIYRLVTTKTCKKKICFQREDCNTRVRFRRNSFGSGCSRCGRYESPALLSVRRHCKHGVQDANHQPGEPRKDREHMSINVLTVEFLAFVQNAFSFCKRRVENAFSKHLNSLAFFSSRGKFIFPIRPNDFCRITYTH